MKPDKCAAEDTNPASPAPDAWHAECTAEECRSRLQAISEGVEMGIFIIDPETHRIVDANPVALKMIGLSLDQVQGEVCHTFVCPAQAGFGPVTDLGKTVDNCERVLLTGTGEKRAIIKTVQPVTISGRKHLLESFLDITDRKEAETALKERTAYLDSLIEVSPLGTVVLDNENRVQTWNPAFENLFHYSSAEIHGTVLEDLIVPEEARTESNGLNRQCRSGDSVHAISRRLRKDGALLDVEIFAAPLIVEGKRQGLLALYQDVTGRKRSERAAAERHRLATLVAEAGVALTGAANLNDGLQRCAEILASHTGVVLARVWTLNGRERALELEASAGTCSSADRAVNPVPMGEHALGRIAASGEPYRTNAAFEDPSVPDPAWARQEEIVAFACYPLKVGEQSLGLVEAYSREPFTDAAIQSFESVAYSIAQFVERARAEASLRENEDRFRRAFDEAPYSMCMTALDGSFLHANAALCQMLGYSPEELLGGTWHQITHPDDLELSRRYAREMSRDAGAACEFEKRYLHKQGHVIWVRLKISAVDNGSGKTSHFIAHIEDITQRKRAEQALRESELRYRELFENATDIVATTDLEGNFTSLNQAGQQTFGYTQEEAARINLLDVVAEGYREDVYRIRARLLMERKPQTVEVELVARDGRHIRLEVRLRLICADEKPIGIQGIARDITSRFIAEMEARQAQKLESVGRLAAGIAHEINTPIQFVSDNARFLQDSFASLQSILGKYRELCDAAARGSVSSGLLAELRRAEEESDCGYLIHEIPEAIAHTLEGVDRVATIVRAMKEFAHPESREMAAADLNKALLSTMTVARNELKYVADIETEFGDLPPVVCNVGDLNQVFLNLLVNAAHAIGEVVKDGEKGRIRVRTSAECDQVLISVSDSGGGIPEAIRNKIFDPFFTTKEVGRGTGQGLAIARSVVVDRHKGSLTFESEVGKGTTFHIRLPLAPPEAGGESNKK
jgi:two-component system, NtrC family, sensor kinase